MPSVETFRRACHEGGFDLVQPFDRAWLDGVELGDHALGAAPGGLGLLVGHTRALWPPFLAARSDEEHPLDRHCEAVVARAAATLGAPARCFFGHHEPPFPIQRVAEAIGFAHLSPSHLSLHPTHGPWIGLRAVVIVEHPYEGPDRITAPRPCDDCDRPCMDALDAAVAQGEAARWRDWLAVRDACPLGRASRYRAAQLRYHYTKDRRWLIPDESD